MGLFIKGYRERKYGLLLRGEMILKTFINTLQTRSEVTATTLELISGTMEPRTS
jgi:hypothetical protein